MISLADQAAVLFMHAVFASIMISALLITSWDIFEIIRVPSRLPEEESATPIPKFEGDDANNLRSDFMRFARWSRLTISALVLIEAVILICWAADVSLGPLRYSTREVHLTHDWVFWLANAMLATILVRGFFLKVRLVTLRRDVFGQFRHLPE